MGCCLGAFVPGCLDARLEMFEAAAGQAPAGAGAAGGSGGNGGVAGIGGGAGQTVDAALLLDDFEDQDNHAEPDGWWYPNDDGSGPRAEMLFEAVTGREPSYFGAHFAAGPVTGYGAFLGLDLPGGVFDASGFSTLSFFARLEPAGDLSVVLQNPQGDQFEAIRSLDANWQEVRIPLTAFLSTGDGGTLDPAELAHLQLWLRGEWPEFDLYVDDVWLLREP